MNTQSPPTSPQRYGSNEGNEKESAHSFPPPSQRDTTRRWRETARDPQLQSCKSDTSPQREEAARGKPPHPDCPKNTTFAPIHPQRQSARWRLLWLPLALALWGLHGCPKPATKACTSQTDCLPNEICYTSLGRCVRLLPPPGSDATTSSLDSPSLRPEPSGPPTCQSGHQCAQGQIQCTVSGWYARCITHPTTGCRVWSPATPCPNQGTCTNDRCHGSPTPTPDQSHPTPEPGRPTPESPPPCQSNCQTVGTQRCQGHSIQQCSQIGTCRQWTLHSTCPNGQICKDTSSGPSCQQAQAYEAELQFCVDEINRYRKLAGRAPLTRSSALEAFGAKAAKSDSQTQKPHGYFSRTRGGGVSRAENEIPGWPKSRYGTIQKVIAEGTKMMYNEGPGGGHYENIVNSRFTQTGCGIYETSDGRVWITHEFR